MTISAINRQHTRKINLHLLRQIINALLAELKIRDAELEINLVAAVEMARLNETFLQHAGPTDVITFDYTNHGGQCFITTSKVRATTKRCRPLHGEIFICVEEAVRQGRKFQASWQTEIVRYVIHGVLHLLGYDDSRVGEHRKMKQEENRLLRQLSRRFSLAQLAHPAKLCPCKSH